jgi:hypothetical protein
MTGLPGWLITVTTVFWNSWVIIGVTRKLSDEFGHGDRTRRLADVLHRINTELLPIVALAFLVLETDASMRHAWIELGMRAVGTALFIWFWHDRDDDDRWQRRRRRFFDLVHRAGNRLTIASTGGPRVNAANGRQ